MCVLAAVAILACCKCMTCNARECGCLKKLLRTMRIDSFPDTVVTVVVSSISYTGSDSVGAVLVRVSAGTESIQTSAVTDGNVRQGFELLIQQGIKEVVIELMDSNGTTVYARLPLDPVVDMRLDAIDYGFKQQMLSMDEVGQYLKKPRVEMAMYPQSAGEDKRFANILDHVDESERIMVEQQLLQTYHENYGSLDSDESGPSEFMLAVKSCSGPVNLYGGWGSRREVYISVIGPPQSADWVLGVWESHDAWRRKKDAQEKINLLRVLSVQPEPMRPDVFVINFMVTRTQKQRLVMERIDRSRDVWVEMIKVTVDYVHERRSRRAKHRNKRHLRVVEGP